MDLAQMMPFAGVLGIELLGSTPEEVRARVAWDPSRCTSGGGLHAGRTTIVVDTELRDAAGRLVARTTQTQAVLPGAGA